MQQSVLVLSPTAIALFKYTKKADSYFELKDLQKDLQEVLGEIYHPEMRLLDILQVVLNTVVKLQEEPRFQINSTSFVLDILKAPIRHSELVLHSKRSNIDDHLLTVKDVVLCQIAHLLNVIKFTNVGWCRKSIYNEEKDE